MTKVDKTKYRFVSFILLVLYRKNRRERMEWKIIILIVHDVSFLENELAEGRAIGSRSNY